MQIKFYHLATLGVFSLLSTPKAISNEECTPCCVPISCIEAEVLLEARVAYYHPTASRTRKIYKGTAIYTVELSVESLHNFYNWMSVGYLYNRGKSIGEKTRTTWDMIPLGFGAKYLFSCWCLRPYLGLGLGLNYVRTCNDSKFVIKNRCNWGVGGVFKSGVIYDWCNCFLVDLFIDYTYMRVGFEFDCGQKVVDCRNADVSGFSFGLGLGYSF